MAETRPIQIHGRPVANGRLPAVCTPLVGRTRAAILGELAAVVALAPDVIEWRADFFEGVGRTAEVVALGRAIREGARGTPILFTRRAVHEGGQPTPLTDAEAVELYAAVCASGAADLVDYELGNPPALGERVREAARAHGVKLILSFHDFERTPAADMLDGKFAEAERRGADVAKVAVTPQGMDDVLALLGATLRAHRALRLPLIGLAMGRYGVLTRLCGWAFGSALTFAVGQGSSAPGQVPVDELRPMVEALRRLVGPVDL
jgi:3-dehydroquinate dehydratase-1